MARYRTIKPEFWTSEQVMECSMNTRLMFIGMWNFADDAGRMPVSPKTIKAQIFPSDDISAETIRRMLDELSSNGLISIYSVDGKEFLQITGWHHQKIDRPQPSKCPEKPDAFDERSSNDRRSFAPERKEGKEGKGKESAATDVAHSASPLDEKADLFRRGKDVLGKNSGGLVNKLIDARGGSIPRARASIEQAACAADAREYIGAIIRGRGNSPEDLRSRGEAW